MPIHGIVQKTHSQCQKSAGQMPNALKSPELVSAGKLVASSWWYGGACRDRTDDLKLAKLALSQLS